MSHLNSLFRSIPILAGLIAVAGVTSPARADDALEMWQQRRASFEGWIRNMASLDKHRIDQILRLRVEKRFLVIDTPLTDIPGEDEKPVKTTLDGITGIAVVTLHHDRAAPEKPLDRFNLMVMDYSVPKEVVTLVVSQMQAGQLMISRSAQNSEGPMHNVMLNQQRGLQSNGGGVVQLTVTESHAVNAAAEQLNFEASDFSGFVRQYPQETERYVRPLLRQLAQESVFAPEPMVAWQVFSDLWQPDPALARRIADLLPRLNSDDYRVRLATQVQLQRLGREGAAVLVRLDRSKLTPEQNVRIDRALIPFEQLSNKEAARLRVDAGFLLDCLYSDNMAIRQAAVDRLRTLDRPDLQFDVNADPESRARAIGSLRQQLIPASLPH